MKSPPEVASDPRSLVESDLFDAGLHLVPGIRETYELELALRETRSLARSELVTRGAYIGSVDGIDTWHVRCCAGQPLSIAAHASERRRSFFATHQFRTGYATHGWFPYRGKFHAQMVRALLNTMGLRSGAIVLDPMMGSGTTLIEASLLGLRGVGIDASPFCAFMAQAKLQGLSGTLDPLREALRDPARVFQRLKSAADRHELEGGVEWQGDLFLGQSKADVAVADDSVLTLAFLDSVGYSLRSRRTSPVEHFRSVLVRYLKSGEKFQAFVREVGLTLGSAIAVEGDARDVPLPDGSVDGVLFSPPYSFAIDYVENDAPHLGALGHDLQRIRERMVGLRGRTRRDKYESYRADMRSVLRECSRVLKPGAQCCIVIGTNDEQLARIFGKATEDVQGLHDLAVELGASVGLEERWRFARAVAGIRNTLKEEYVVMLRRE